jgi:hypothetical protein
MALKNASASRAPDTRSGSSEPSASDARRAYSISDFCYVYGVGRTHAYAEISAGRLHARKAGRRTLITIDAAEAWLEQLPELSGNKVQSRMGGEA